MEIFLGFVLSLLALLLLRDTLNRFIFQFLIAIIQNEKVATLIFALLFFPGVVIHELSHWLMAKFLFVKTHRFSIFPEWVEGGTLRFGFVEMSKTDKLRGALIGLAPLITGILVILLIAFYHLNLEVVVEGIAQFDLETAINGIKGYLSTADVLLWSYMLLAVSNTMLPSKSDRKAWLPVVIAFLIIYISIIFIAPGSPTGIWLIEVAGELSKTLTKAFAVAAVLNFLLLLPLWLLDLGLKRFRG